MLYDYISDDVRKYWTHTEEYLNKVESLLLIPVSDELAISLEAARHNLRMIISQINSEMGRNEMLDSD